MVSVDAFSQGMAEVRLSRKLADGMVASGVFLVDLHCLGVKDAYLRIATETAIDPLRIAPPAGAGRIPLHAAGQCRWRPVR
jgi:hypothetical protein